jgi:hypothetical protein
VAPMIRVDGIQVRRVLIPVLADALIHADDNELASKLLTASAEQRDVELGDSERAAILSVLERGAPDELEDLRVALARVKPDTALPAEDV